MAFWFLLCALRVVLANDIDIGYNPTLATGEDPELVLTPSADIRVVTVVIEMAGNKQTFTRENEPAGQELVFTWKANAKVTEVNAEIKAVFTDGFVAQAVMPMEFSYGTGLTVDYQSVQANLAAKELSVRVTGFAAEAEVIAFGAEKKILDQRTIRIDSGPGTIVIPWVGEVQDVVLLDITLRNEQAFAGFTYSPWFLDVPHQDVLFESNSARIEASEEWKLESTYSELEEVLRKYGSVVPVKLYIAGCTDTVGDKSHNKELSKERARAIAAWLRNRGYESPIYYYGFGESLLSVQTRDGVDEPANRRVLYIVTSDVPPDLPQVGWRKLP